MAQPGFYAHQRGGGPVRGGRGGPMMAGRGPAPTAQGQVAVTVTVNATAPVQGQGQGPAAAAGRGGLLQQQQGGRGQMGVYIRLRRFHEFVYLSSVLTVF